MPWQLSKITQMNLRSSYFFIGQNGGVWTTNFFFDYLNFVQLNVNLKVCLLITLSKILFKGG